MGSEVGRGTGCEDWSESGYRSVRVGVRRRDSGFGLRVPKPGRKSGCGSVFRRRFGVQVPKLGRISGYGSVWVGGRGYRPEIGLRIGFSSGVSGV